MYISATCISEKFFPTQTRTNGIKSALKIASERYNPALRMKNGLNAENANLNRFQEIFKKKIRFREYETSIKLNNIVILGRIDAITTDDQIIELKNRVDKLKGVFLHERVQCHLYMKMLDMKSCLLFESYQNEHKGHDIQFDDALWTRIEDVIYELA